MASLFGYAGDTLCGQTHPFLDFRHDAAHLRHGIAGLLQQVGYLDRFARELELGAAACFEIEKEAAQWKAAAAQLGPMGRNAATALEKLRDAMDRVRANMRCLRTLNALQACAKANPKVHELGLGEQATVDPFDGKPLRLKKGPGGWIVYSIGTNRKDDGGTFDKRQDIGAGAAKKAD